MATTTLKLLVNKKKNKVLFGEAGKDFVDVLFSFLTLPLGTIARLVVKESNIPSVRVACLSSLYKSVANLDKESLWTEACKEMLLQPRNSSEHYCRSLKLNIDDTEPTKFFICLNLDCCSSKMLSTFRTSRCGCGNLCSKQIPLKSSNVYEGFVSGGATFIITDDLIVMPNSMDTSFGLLNNLGIKKISSVQQITVNVTHEKVLDLLKCSLLSKSTLTHFFLEKKPSLPMSSFSPCNIAAKYSSIQINVKLMMRKSDGKILFAQGEEDFADFLFSFLTFPLGAVVRVLGGYSSVGSVDGLYKSIADLNENKYLKAMEVKNRLVDPGLATQFKLSKQILPIYESPDTLQYHCYYKKRAFKESIINNQCYLASGYSPGADETCTTLRLYDPGNPTGYAKGPTMYMATDDLVVAPMSPISGISLLNSLNTPLSDVKEEAVTIGIKEGLSILKASLTSTSALTNGLKHLIVLKISEGKLKGKKLKGTLKIGKKLEGEVKREEVKGEVKL